MASSGTDLAEMEYNIHEYVLITIKSHEDKNCVFVTLKCLIIYIGSGPWMHCKSWTRLCYSALQPIFPSGHSWYCSDKSPCSPKSVFPIDHHYKRDVCKTVDRTPPTANNVNYDSFYYVILIQGRFYICKTILEPRKAI